MGKFIKFGKYNKLYKYVWIYILICLVNQYLFEYSFPDEFKFDLIRSQNYPNSIFIQELFNHIGTFIYSFILYKYEMFQNKKENNDSSIPILVSKKTSLIYNDYEQLKITDLKLYIEVIILLIICNELIVVLYVIGLNEFEYWAFEILFISFISSIMFKKEIYIHQKISIYFIIISCSFIIFLSNIFELKDDSRMIYKEYIWLIPIGIIIFILNSFLRAYIYCKLKWLLEYKYMSLSKFLIWYGLISSLIYLLASIISSNIKCVDKNIFEDIDLICYVKITDDNNSTLYYFDTFSNYFSQLWRNNRSALLNFVYIFLIFIKTIIYFFTKLFFLLIIKKLNPVFFICTNSIFFFILELVDCINTLIILKEEYNYFGILAEFFNILGTLYYLEIFEFECCGLNYNFKNNIEKRSQDDYLESNNKFIENNGTY